MDKKNFENIQLDGWPYVLTKFLAGGAFGTVYLARDIKTSQIVAVKFETKEQKIPQLPLEYTFYTKLEGSPYHPKIFGFGIFHDEFYFLIAELLGPSLKNVMEKCNGFTQRCCAAIAIKMLQIFEFTHSRGIIHRDVKPDNYLFGGVENNPLQLYMIDLGIAKEYIVNGRHIPMENLPILFGTLPFISVAMHNKKTNSRRDDLEALGYILVHLYKTKLPWVAEGLREEPTKRLQIYFQAKLEPAAKIFSGMDKVFVKYFEAVKKLQFEETPKYDEYIALLDEYLISKHKMTNLEAALDFNAKYERKNSLTRLDSKGSMKKNKKTRSSGR